VKIVPENSEVIIPKRATEGSAGFDVYAPKDFKVYPGARQFVPLNFSLEIKEGWCAILSHRSGINKNFGIQAYGIIDSDYRGIVGITLINTGIRTAHFLKGDRVGQLMFLEVPSVILRIGEDLTSTKRGGGGHGSTGA
jgi:dUTP pyrophosphatase